MRTLVKLLAALLILPALLGADSCQRERPSVQSDRPPEDRQVDPKRARKAWIYANSTGPYNLRVVTTEPGKPGSERTSPDPYPAAGGKFEGWVDYTSGDRLKIWVEVRARHDDRVDCSINDGELNTIFRVSTGYVECELVTQR